MGRYGHGVGVFQPEGKVVVGGSRQGPAGSARRIVGLELGKAKR